MADAAGTRSDPDAASQGGDTAAAAPGDAPPKPAVTFAKRSKNRSGNLRKRAAAEDGDGAGADDGVVRKSKAAKESSMAFTTKRDDKTETFKFVSDRTLQQRDDQGATRGLDVDTQPDRDARAIRERQLAASADPEAAVGDGTYKGTAGYVDFRAGFRREQHLGGDKGKGAYGPLRSNAATVRSTIRVDYQPDICKDYKETGYCGYGDACKFMHDRGDYKMGWEIDREWDARQKAERERVAKWEEEEEGGGEGLHEEEEEDDGLPFACWICRRPWEQCTDPVVTKCGHHFCEQCALKHNARSSKCSVCEQPTAGIFNVAHDIVRKVKAKKRTAEAAGK